MTEARKPKPPVVCDIETYHGFFLIAFKRLTDGQIRTFELSDRSTFDRERVLNILLTHKVITFNGLSYDLPMIIYALDLMQGAGFAAPGEINAQLKRASDQIITGNVKYWEVENLLGISIPRGIEHIDLIEPQPNAWASLKTLNGRLHGKRMQDLPIEPDGRLTHADMDLLTSYCCNDLAATELLYEALKDPLDLRAALSAEYGQNFMSKSDAQIGEAIVKKRVEQATKEKVQKVPTPAGTSFPYRVPDYLRFEHPALVDIVDRLRRSEFIVKHDGKVDLPSWLAEKSVVIGDTTYAMGIGGLHSTEANRQVLSDDGFQLIDFDVASYYPAIILQSGLYPRSLGPKFLEVYRKIRDDRVVAKRRAAALEKIALERELSEEEKQEWLACKAAAEGLKIALNGVFGKLGSIYSVLYAPHLLISVTLTGQLALLMLIERAEAAGIPVVSANTDGVVFRCPDELRDKLDEITKAWEAETGFELESTHYRALYSRSVNSYIAIKDDGKAKRKGAGLVKQRDPKDLRTQLMNNPGANVCAEAVVEHLTQGTDIAEYIRGCRDIRDFVTVVNVRGGGTWRDEYLGKVVRYVWSTDGAEILYKTPDPRTGNHKKVSKTDGCRPLMELPEEWPEDVDYDRYIAVAHEILMDIGFKERPPPVKPVRIYRYNALLWFALAA